ncbi:hypothetical protein DV738_g100, partial [Chaetothyriales sp. CBS 135597]
MDAGSDSFKPPERSASYTDLSKQGKVPKSDSAASEAHLASHGIFTDEVKGDMLVSEDSKKMCEEMFNAQFDDPVYTQFPLSSFLLIWNRLRAAQVAFYRHRIDSFSLGPGRNMGNRKKAYDFVREVYKSFYPAHLKRIQDALKQMKDPRAQSMLAASMSVDQSSSGAPGSTVPSSEQTTTTNNNKSTPEFKKPDVPAGKKRKGKQAQQDDWLKEQLLALREEKAQQEARYAEEKAQQEARYAEEKARQEKLYAELERRYTEEKARQERLYTELEKRYEEQEKRYAEEKIHQARQIELLQQVLNQVNRQ